MARIVAQIVLLECGHEYKGRKHSQKCPATAEITVNADGFIPAKQVAEEACKIGWEGSIMEKGKDRCPKHKISEKKETP